MNSCTPIKLPSAAELVQDEFLDLVHDGQHLVLEKAGLVAKLDEIIERSPNAMQAVRVGNVAVRQGVTANPEPTIIGLACITHVPASEEPILNKVTVAIKDSDTWRPVNNFDIFDTFELFELLKHKKELAARGLLSLLTLDATAIKGGRNRRTTYI